MLKTTVVVAPYFAPTTKAALLTFLIAGPLFWLPILLAFSSNVYFLHPLTWMIGGIFWIMSLRNPTLWFVTWIPTATAAVACAFVLRRMAGTSWYSRTRRGLVLSIGGVLCGLISGLIYLFGARLVALIDPETSVQSAAAANLRDLYSSGTRIAMLWYGVPLVSVIGALLGGWLAWWSYPRNRSSKNQE